MTLEAAYGAGGGVTLEDPVIKVGANGQSYELDGLIFEDIDSPVGPIAVTAPATGKYIINYTAQFLCDNADAVVEILIGIKVDTTFVPNSEVMGQRCESGSSMGDERFGVSGTMTLTLTEGEVVEMQAWATANTGTTSVTSNAFGRTKIEIIHYGE